MRRFLIHLSLLGLDLVGMTVAYVHVLDAQIIHLISSIDICWMVFYVGVRVCELRFLFRVSHEVD